MVPGRFQMNFTNLVFHAVMPPSILNTVRTTTGHLTQRSTMRLINRRDSRKTYKKVEKTI